ncbi:hypothetical protein PYW07_005912 [Mythimna separata]|uniref:Rap1 Myb domain-containing protein n=1 Tax=Mythimna separata TaxID=271217 RepID=A0AAD7YIY5_MYTSE|nr:hypothetical protein PYW07_005912 [Mythimna separata]
MSGKPYNIQEFKIIVDYLVQNKLYSEIKARKMWVDFANTKLTSRTWQSLKETFLKRILPDIHNPYFQLTNEQISSFRARCDLADRNSNKLEIQTISDDSNSNGHNVKDNEPTNEGETSAGENIKCSKVPVRSRSSADTVIIENCYETAEDIQKALESDDKPREAAKSFRDCITYSEPLTPMLQEVLDDFASEPEDSDREGQMEIVENVSEVNLDDVQEIPEPANEILNSKSIATDVAKNAKGLSAEVVEEVLAHELDGSNKPENKTSKKTTQNVTNEIEQLPLLNLDEEISSMQAENGTEINDADTDVETSEATKLVTAQTTELPGEVTEDPVVETSSETPEVIVITDSHSPQEQSGGLNNSNSTVDASLPNNPEALKNKSSKDVEAKADSKEAPKSAVDVSTNSDQNRSSKKALRKRSSSEDNSNAIDNKKKKLDIKLKSPTKADKQTTELQLATDELKAQEESIKPDVIKKPRLEKHPIDTEKPSTSYQIHEVDVMETEERSDVRESPAIKNPCLQNISLFDEQFNKTKYNMSESSDTELNKKETQGNKQETSESNPVHEVVVLRSNSSDNREMQVSPRKKQRAGVLISKSERDKAVSNMFGFTSGGGVGAKRKRQLSRRRRTISHNTTSHHTAAPASNSSDWTSQSESDEFVSPPRSRKNRPTRKYMKPQSAKISSLAEEGGLFVMYGKKIYPVVKDGKIVKNYITYLPESDSEEENGSFWKTKYVEEKKKAAELQKLLETKEAQQTRDTHTPVPQANPLRNSPRESLAVEPTNGFAKQISVPVPEEKKEEPKPMPPEKIKIKFTRNNEEVHLEGHWPQIHPVLEQVVHIFHKESEPAVNENKSKAVVAQPEQKELSSGGSTPVIITPVDPEVHEKVNEIEKEIFKEIEERDKEEENEPNGTANNVTKRKIGRPRKSSSSTHSPEKQPKLSNGAEIKEPEENGRTRRQKAKETENNNNIKENLPKRQPRTPRKILNETVNINESKTMQTRRSKQSLNSSVANEDEEVRYMLPPKNSRTLKSPANKKTGQKKSLEKTPKILSPADTVSLNSMDSTQGYQDSDASAIYTENRKKKKNHMSSFMMKTRHSLRNSTRKRTLPYVYHDAYNDTSNSSADASVRVVTRENSSLNTEAYRSESYQLLNVQAKASSRQLEPIDETSTIANQTYFVRNLGSVCRDEMLTQTNNNITSPSYQMTSDVGSSSNVSLPMSPELSLVENLSVSREVLNTADFPTLNEMQSNEMEEANMCSKYMISNVDVSVPLMNQEWEFGNGNMVTEMSTEPKSLVTESLVREIGTFNINEQVSATETLNAKLHDLLLESAKKTAQTQCAQNPASMMDVDVSAVTVQKKSKVNKKRCSTPQKRKGSKKSVAPSVEPVVEEEHIESCSHSGRKSCPPVFQTNMCNDNVIEEINLSNLTISNEKPIVRKKKDIIRVKILRPRNKNATEKLRAKSAQEASRISVFTDSGINDSESELFVPSNESVDLIHNHSETCLHANECVGDSIEFVENSKSVITLGDSMQSGDNAWSTQCENTEEHSLSPDLFCNNAQDVSSYNRAHSDSINNTSDTVYYSPLGTDASPNSLITEDLSYDVPPPAPNSKWYLLSEDETNTNLIGTGSTMLSGANFGGSNLRQIFPIACAIPDLSTITEMSRENDSSRKPNLEDLNGLTGDDFNSLSVFDSNF